MTKKHNRCSRAEECAEFNPDNDTRFMRQFVGSKHFVAILTVFLVGGADGLKEKVWPHEEASHWHQAIEATLDTLDKKMDRLTDRIDNLVVYSRPRLHGSTVFTNAPATTWLPMITQELTNRPSDIGF